MKRILYAGVALLAAAVLPAQAADTVKVGMIISLSGQFADTGMQMLNGAKLYVKQHGDTVTGKKIEIIAKDVGGINPPVAKRLAQELVTRDNVDVPRRFRPHAERACGCGRLPRGQEVYGQYERGDRDRH